MASGNPGGSGRFNPLYSAAEEVAASKSVTSASKNDSEADFYISSRCHNSGGASSRRQAFIYGSSGFYDQQRPLLQRPRSHDLYGDEAPTSASYLGYQDRYLQVPQQTSCYSNRYSFDSCPPRPQKSSLDGGGPASASFRHHSVDSPDQMRRMHFGKSSHHVNELLRDFQLHSGPASNLASSGLTTNGSHTRLLEADDEDYGQLYVGTDESVEDVDKHLFDYEASFDDRDEVPGPAPEVEPPRPAPSGGVAKSASADIYSSSSSSAVRHRSSGYESQDYHHAMMTHYGQNQQQTAANAQPRNAELPYVNRDLNDNYNGDNQRNPQHFHHHQNPGHSQEMLEDTKQDFWKQWNSTSNGGLISSHAANNGHAMSHYNSLTTSAMMNNFNNQNHNHLQYLNSAEQTSYHVLPSGAKEDVGVNLDMMRPKDDPTTYFNDGIRKIDFVLVFEESEKDMEFQDELDNNAEFDQTGKGLKKRQKFSLWRQKFMASLHTIGLEIEEEVLHRSKNTLHFIRLHGPWPLLCRFAEELNLRAPIQAHPNPSGNWSGWVLSKLRLPNMMAEDVPNKPLDYYTCPFKTSKIDKFLGSEDPNTFFSRAQRSRMVYEILATTPFGKEKKGEVGIERMVEEGAYSAAFPLHDGPFEHPGPGTPGSQLNTRQILFDYWARWGKWYKYQPLDHIREYFGEKIAIYFAWLGFYTGWLLPAAVVGVLVFLYGVFTMNSNTIAVETCHHGDQYLMCPLCETCDYWKLKDICWYKRIAYLFDHPGTVFYAIFMSFWAVTFLEYWKRKSASLAHHWDCMGFQEEEERPRPAFAAKAPYLEKNPITGVKEPSFPQSKRYQRIAAGTGLILLMICLVLIFILAVIIYRTLVQIPLFQNETLRPVAQMIASMSGAMVNLLLIMLLGRVYEKLALRLTTWEMHRTQSEFDDNLTFKVFLFQFINFYSSIFYIAFFKGRFVGYPGHYKHIFGNLRNEDCSNGGCLIELAQQLAVIMVGKQIINNAQEILIPKLKAWWHNKKSKLAHIGESRMEMDYKLVENEGLFQEYLEMVLQFGFITIFVAAFPLAPFFALLNNWVEIRLDAQKFVCETRRAVAERAENIGIWFKILDMLAQFAVITNAFLIAFTSEFIPKLVYKYEHAWNMSGYVNFTLATSPYSGWLSEGKNECRYRAFRDKDGEFTPSHYKILGLKLAFVIIFEHVVFGVCRLIDLVVPDIPESLDVKIKRERYLAKEALQDADHVLQKVLTDHDSDRVDSDLDVSALGSPMTRKRGL